MVFCFGNHFFLAVCVDHNESEVFMNFKIIDILSDSVKKIPGKVENHSYSDKNRGLIFFGPPCRYAL